MAVALTSSEAPNIVAAAVKECKGETVNCPESMAGGFKKKLQDCEAMMVLLVQQPTMNGSDVSTEDGIQEDPGMLTEASGVDCIIEGLEMPPYPTGVTVTPPQTAEVPVATPEEDVVQKLNAGMEGHPETPQTNARTQNTTAGDTPVKTQDEILKTLGEHLEPKAAGDQPQTNAENVSKGQEPSTAAVPAATQETKMVPDKKNGPEVNDLPVKHEAPHAVIQDEEVKPMDTSAATTEGPKTAPLETTTVAVEAPDSRTEAAQYTRDNVLRIVDKVSTHAAEGRYDFDVELKPDFLGKVSIKLSMQDGAIRLQIKADDMSVRSMLADQTTALQSALKDKGIELSSVDVTYQSQASLNGGGQPFEQHNGSGRQGGAYYAQADTSAFETAAETYSYFVGNSSVEFLA